VVIQNLSYQLFFGHLDMLEILLALKCIKIHIYSFARLLEIYFRNSTTLYL